MNATKALAISMAGAAALALWVSSTLDEPSGGAALSPGIRINQTRRMPPPRAEGGRMLRDVNRQTFRSAWPLVKDKATIACRPSRIATLITSSGEYALSGRAIAAGYPSIWDSVLPIEVRRDAALGPLVKAALALCPDTEGGEPWGETEKDGPITDGWTSATGKRRERSGAGNMA